eukprot:2724715-Prymnesium_polylepis.2
MTSGMLLPTHACCPASDGHGSAARVAMPKNGHLWTHSDQCADWERCVQRSCTSVTSCDKAVLSSDWPGAGRLLGLSAFGTHTHVWLPGSVRWFPRTRFVQYGFTALQYSKLKAVPKATTGLDNALKHEGSAAASTERSD